VAGLDPEEAVAKLLAQNHALTSHIGRLRNVSEDNKALRDDNETLASKCKLLETELKRQAEILQITKSHDRWDMLCTMCAIAINVCHCHPCVTCDTCCLGAGNNTLQRFPGSIAVHSA
jgi:hypothetical protein